MTAEDIDKAEYEAEVIEVARKAHALRAVVPRDPRETRLRMFFTQQDEFWRFHEWPKHFQEMALMKHKPYRERYRLFLFFVWNGLNPLTARMWVVMQDWKGRFIEEEYDRSAWSQLDDQVKKTFTKEIFLTPGLNMFDMVTGKVEFYSPELK